ncbi:MAG TPA: response regulator [Pyrinomonadaceae bacterium]|nr:response regulator [Pyrinomonadaceae bacterium]
MEGSTLRLLIVDDDEVVRDVLKLKLKDRSDILLNEASSANEAIKSVEQQKIDLVLLDLRLQVGAEGLDVLSEIKRLQPKTQIIMLSAYGTTPAIVEAMKRGAYDFVAKDKDYEDLVVLKLDKFINDSVLIEDRERNIKGLYETTFIDDSQRKGKALETLVAAVFSSVEGLIEVDRNINTETEEIDIVFRNESNHPSWQRESSLVLVECKNWLSQRVGKNEFVAFKDKIENRFGRCRLGFLICTDRFAETFTKEMLRSSKSDLLIVPIDGSQLLQLVNSENRNQCLIDFMTASALL